MTRSKSRSYKEKMFLFRLWMQLRGNVCIQIQQRAASNVHVARVVGATLSEGFPVEGSFAATKHGQTCLADYTATVAVHWRRP